MELMDREEGIPRGRRWSRAACTVPLENRLSFTETNANLKHGARKETNRGRDADAHWSCGITRFDKVRNEELRRRMQTAPIQNGVFTALKVVHSPAKKRSTISCQSCFEHGNCLQAAQRSLQKPQKDSTSPTKRPKFGPSGAEEPAQRNLRLNRTNAKEKKKKCVRSILVFFTLTIHEVQHLMSIPTGLCRAQLWHRELRRERHELLLLQNGSYTVTRTVRQDVDGYNWNLLNGSQNLHWLVDWYRMNASCQCISFYKLPFQTSSRTWNKFHARWS